jgi:ADP-ribosylglycohydrolase
MADAWKEHVSPLMKEFWVPELFVAIELGMGSSPREIGSRNIRGDGAAMSIDPIGVINSCNPRNAAMDARDVAGLSQAGEQVEAAMSVASAVAKAFEVEAQPDEVVAAAKEFGGPVMTKKIEEAMKIASSSGSIQRKYQKLYDEVAIEDGTSGYVRRWREGNIAKYRAADISMGISPVEVVAVAIAFFHYTNGRVMETINCCARYGRDADSIAGIAGSIAGALKGGETLEKGLVEKIDAANSTSLEDLATKVGAVVRRTITEEEAKLEEGRSLLDTL